MEKPAGEHPDEWIALAGRVPEDISQIVSEQPFEVPELLRAVRGLTPEQFRKLREAERIIVVGIRMSDAGTGKMTPRKTLHPLLFEQLTAR